VTHSNPYQKFSTTYGTSTWTTASLLSNGSVTNHPPCGLANVPLVLFVSIYAQGLAGIFMTSNVAESRYAKTGVQDLEGVIISR